MGGSNEKGSTDSTSIVLGVVLGVGIYYAVTQRKQIAAWLNERSDDADKKSKKKSKSQSNLPYNDVNVNASDNNYRDMRDIVAPSTSS
jgi:hypothetical protein